LQKNTKLSTLNVYLHWQKVIANASVTAMVAFLAEHLPWLLGHFEINKNIFLLKYLFAALPKEPRQAQHLSLIG